MGRHALYYEQIHLKEEPVVARPTTGDGAHDVEARERLAELERSDAEILAAYPASSMKAAVERKMRSTAAMVAEPSARGARKPLRFPVRNGAIGAFAAAACCVLVVSYLSIGTLARRGGETNYAQAGETLVASRLKGTGPRIFVYLKESEGARLLAPETRVKAGDTVQISYLASGDSYGAIVSVDGSGLVTRHYPESGDSAAELSQSGEVPLDFSYLLDDAPRFERFFLVSGNDRFSVSFFAKKLSDPAISKALGNEPLPETAIASLADTLPAGVHVTQIILRK